MTATVTTWWWVRHAPVVGLDGVLYGADDVPCDTSNRPAFERLAAILPDHAHWLTSHLSRTHQTADAIRAAGLDFPAPQIEAQLGEQDFGDWQGRTWAEMEQRDSVVYRDFWESPARSRPPNGESFLDQVDRTAAVIERITAARPGQSIVAVAHGGTIRAAICHAVGLTPEAAMSFTTDNLAVTCLQHVDGGLLRGRGGDWRVVCINRPAV